MQKLKHRRTATMLSVTSKFFPVTPTTLNAMLKLFNRFVAIRRRRRQHCAQRQFGLPFQQLAHHETLAVTQTTKTLVIEIIRNMQFIQLEHVHPQPPHIVGFKITHHDLKRITLAVSRFNMTVGLTQHTNGQRLVAEADSFTALNRHHLRSDTIFVF